MKRIAGITAFVALASLAYACAHLQMPFGALSPSVAAWHGSGAEPLVSNGIDGGRPPAAHVND
ncbi:MAG TPA: hypothetical protein VFE23_19580 [Usitatibacter sp.]|nr:hypothetical protein [Usitatibacter sp.]